MMSMDEKYMKEAIRQAKKAYALDETPIGCVIVHEGKIIGRGIIGEIRIRVHWHMQRLQRFERRVKSLVTGGWKNARYM